VQDDRLEGAEVRGDNNRTSELCGKLDSPARDLGRTLAGQFLIPGFDL
jgi:hypothetical protein